MRPDEHRILLDKLPFNTKGYQGEIIKHIYYLIDNVYLFILLTICQISLHNLIYERHMESVCVIGHITN